MRAAVASLFEMDLYSVPNFLEFQLERDAHLQMMDFFTKRGHHPTWVYKERKGGLKELLRIAEYDGGIDGYFYASVPSQTFKDCVHAIIVDTKLNIVHDPNPNQLALKLGPRDIRYFLSVSDFIISDGILMSYEEWKKL